MKTYTLLRRGSQHKDFCEDALMVLQPSPDWWIGVVSDGCSSGRDSHFASALTCKLVRQTVAQTDFGTQPFDSQILSQHILFGFLQGLSQTQQLLHLPEEELLATLILAVYHSDTQEACLTVLGDGVLVADQEIRIIDQDNQPDYPAYYLNKPHEWETYCQKQVWKGQGWRDISISTDGILQFRQYKKMESELVGEPLDFLLKNDFLVQHTQMLGRKTNILETQYGWLPADDLGLIRLII